jgi:hypothetical protein
MISDNALSIDRPSARIGEGIEEDQSEAAKWYKCAKVFFLKAYLVTSEKSH